MTNRRQRHVSPEKNLTMAERMERIEQERIHIDSFDRNRQLQPGQLTPRARIAALVDEESFLEIGAFAKSQHRDAAAETPADGVITGYAEIGGRRVVVLAEDPVALANTDAQVGKNKRNRMISNAIYRRLPIVYLADGTPDESPEFDMHRGFLLSRVADQVPARDIAERDAPLITIAFGLCAGQNGSLAVRSDLLIATTQARFGALDGSPGSVADLVSDDDPNAIAAAQRFLGTLPAELGTPLQPLSNTPAVPSNILKDEFMDARPEEQFESIFDAEGSVLLSDTDETCLVGLGRIEGFPVGVCADRRFAACCADDGRHETDRPRSFVERRLPDPLPLNPGHARLRPVRRGDRRVHVRRGPRR